MSPLPLIFNPHRLGQRCPPPARASTGCHARHRRRRALLGRRRRDRDDPSLRGLPWLLQRHADQDDPDGAVRCAAHEHQGKRLRGHACGAEVSAQPRGVIDHKMCAAQRRRRNVGGKRSCARCCATTDNDQ
eukprot:359724-Chlamydomonas_euryale.AAC.6